MKGGIDQIRSVSAPPAMATLRLEIVTPGDPRLQ
jgi:hypothetical protein